MKQVIINPLPNQYVQVNQVDELKYYGYRRHSTDLGLITREGFKCGKWKTFAANQITNGNHNGRNYEFLSELLINLIELNFEIYEFTTVKELFSWLAENANLSLTELYYFNHSFWGSNELYRMKTSSPSNGTEFGYWNNEKNEWKDGSVVTNPSKWTIISEKEARRRFPKSFNS